MSLISRYDAIGSTYANTRRADPRIAVHLDGVLAGVGTVLNVGAGTGSYEPSHTVLAIEPSRVMIAQRPPETAPVVCARAEALPLFDSCVDATLAVLTVHHWTDLETGISELRRVTRRRIVILTFDPEHTTNFWLLKDYFPALARTHRNSTTDLPRLVSALGAKRTTTTVIPVPHDCTDGFASAYWRRPESYLDATVRSGMSLFADIDGDDLTSGLQRLARDVDSGLWHRRYATLLDQQEYDAGYRLVVTDLG